MTITGVSGYGYRRREFIDSPRRQFTRAELRDRRRRRQPVVLDGEFDLAAEVGEITGPLADAVAHRSPTPPVHRLAVRALADTLAEIVFVAVALLAESDADRRTRHIADLNDRARARRLLIDRAQRPTAPVIEVEHLHTGEWSALLVEYATQVADDLAELLRRAVPPGGRRGTLSASERIVDALRPFDAAARTVEASVERAVASASASRAVVRSDLSADAELRALGVEL